MGHKIYPPKQKLPLWDRLLSLSEEAKYETISTSEVQDLPLRCWIYPAQGRGKPVPIMKTLLSNICSHNCLYCPHRKDREYERMSLEPEEIASSFGELLRRGVVEGIFLSSAIEDSPAKTMDLILKTAEIIREKIGFTGYMHLKVMPGAEKSQVERACELATRISINIEAPEKYLKKISPEKEPSHIIPQISWIKDFLKGDKSQTTQFVVGAADEKDIDILRTTENLIKNFNIRRCYFSNLRPVPNTPLENKTPPPKIREIRLYQAEILIRKYGFKPDELFLVDGNLPLEKDPKTLWAEKNPHKFPVEINRAEFEELIRVPGIGHETARRIIKVRKEGKIKGMRELKHLGVNIKRAVKFITVDGRWAGYEEPHLI